MVARISPDHLQAWVCLQGLGIIGHAKNGLLFMARISLAFVIPAAFRHLGTAMNGASTILDSSRHDVPGHAGYRFAKEAKSFQF